jgi:polysaccharide pyruvyl transferase CsaB
VGVSHARHRTSDARRISYIVFSGVVWRLWHLAGAMKVSGAVENPRKAGPVLVIGYYGAGNLGDDLLMEAVASALERSGVEVSVGLRTLPSEAGTSRRGFRTPFISPTIAGDLVRLVRESRDSSAIVLGGGGVFQDTHHFWTVAEFVLPLALAALFSKPAVVWAAGIGPYRNRLNRALATLGLDLATTVTVRDSRSAGLAGVPSDLVEDPVWWLARRASSRAEPATGRMGFVLREWEGFDVDAAVDLVARCYDVAGKAPLLIPFEYSKDNARDYEFAEQIREGLAKRGIAATIPLNKGYPTVEECWDAIASCDLLVTMRFHGAMLALANDVPVCAIACSPKIADLLHAGGLEQQTIAMSDLRSGRVQTVVQQLATDRAATIAAQRAGRERILSSGDSRAKLVSAVDSAGKTPGRRKAKALLALAACSSVLVVQSVVVGGRKLVRRLRPLPSARKE